MAHAEIVTANCDHLLHVCRNMRQQDRDELAASYPGKPETALMQSYSLSANCWAGLVDGECICLFGVVPAVTVGRIGRPWMIGTPGIEKHEKIFLRRCKGVVHNMLRDYTYLYNYVDVRNDRAMRWLNWLGFEFSGPEAYGPYGMPFMRFTMEAK